MFQFSKKSKKKKKKDETVSPVLYAKPMYSEKSNKFLTIFKTKNNKSVDPFD